MEANNIIDNEANVDLGLVPVALAEDLNNNTTLASVVPAKKKRRTGSELL